jgi:hypothetical protein
MGRALELFQEIIQMLLEVQHDDRAPPEIIERVSNL